MTRLPSGYIPQSVSSLAVLASTFRAETGGMWRDRISEVCGLGLNGHGARVGCMNRILSERLAELDEREAVMAGQLHDIGKILVPDTILGHNGALSESQRAIINKHPDYGHMILTTVLDFPPGCVVTNAALSHHERWDGTGYPNGLEKENIPLEARTTSISDVIDALASPRAYKPGWGWDRITGLLAKEAGKAFDPELVALTLDCIPEIIAAREEEVQRQHVLLPLDEIMVFPECVVTATAIAEDARVAHVVETVIAPVDPGKEPGPVQNVSLNTFGAFGSKTL